MTRRILWIAMCTASAALAVGCSDEEKPTPSEPAPEITSFQPVGTINGLVADAYDRMPLANAKVTINYGGQAHTTTTTAEGTFSFADVPATGNPNGAASRARGTYAMALDLSGVQVEGRTYRPYRTQDVTVEFTSLDSTPPAANTTAPAALPVDHLMSNISFLVRQTRATIAGTTYKAPALTPLVTDLLLMVSNSSSLPTGAVYAKVTTAADGTFSFTAVEEGASFSIAAADQNLVLDTSGFNYTGGAIYANEGGVTTRIRPLVLQVRNASDNFPPYVVTASPFENQVLGIADVGMNIVLTFNEPMMVDRGADNAVSSLYRVGRRNLPDDPNNRWVKVATSASWDSTATVLTINPANDLEPGFRYRLAVSNAALVDLSGNQRTGNIPVTSPVLPDELAVAGGTNDLDFGIGAGASIVAVTGLAQEQDTADNRSSAVGTRAEQMERVNVSEQSFKLRQAAGFYPENSTSYAYIFWDKPTAAVARFNVYTRFDSTSPAAQVTNTVNSPLGNGHAKVQPLPGTVTAYDISLNDLNTILVTTYGIGFGNTTWDNLLAVDLGVAAVNADGVEGPVSWVTLRDNTAPAFTFASYGMDNAFYGGLPGNLSSYDSISLTDNQSCKNVGNVQRTMCPQTPLAQFGDLVASDYGQRVVLFDLSELVDAASVTPANLLLVSGTLPTGTSPEDPNTNGSATEPDATILDAKAYNPVNGRATRIAVLFDNWFGLDTGDRLVLANGANGLKDVVGNVAKDSLLITAPFVDRVPPMIKSVKVDPATDTLTLTFTKWIRVVTNASYPASNIDPGQFTFNTVPSYWSWQSQLQSATYAINSGGEAAVAFRFNDVSYFRGFNDPSWGTGTRVYLNSVPGADVFDTSGNRTYGGDYGVQAYANVPPDVADLSRTPGAYADSATGTPKFNSLKDFIGPRLSNDFTQRSTSWVWWNNWPYDNSLQVNGGGGQQSFLMYFALTEPTPNFDGTAASPSALNPANWAATFVDLGNDLWTGNTPATDAAAANLGVEVTGVYDYGSDGNYGLPGNRYLVQFRLTNNAAPGLRTFGLARLTLSTAVTDRAVPPNPVSTHNGYTYNPTRKNPSGTTVPGFDRN